MSIADKLATIAENEQKVYDAGRDDAWNFFCSKGEFAFAAKNFSLIGGFNPPFQIKPVGSANHIFYWSQNAGVIKASDIDFSEVTNMNSAFDQTSGISEIELMDLRNVKNFNYMLSNNYSILTVGKIILKDDGSQTFANSTFEAHWLRNITFEGKIGANVSFRFCSGLTYESLMSIINALKDYSGTGETRTLTLHATAKARLSESDIATATQKGWTIS